MRVRIVFFLLLFCQGLVQAQDAQFSQYYNAPLFLNPAFAGTADNTRAVFNYRMQWPNLVRPYTTMAASFDHFFEPVNSAAGVIIRRDQEGAGGLTSTEAGLIYSYVVPLSYEWTLIPSVQGSFVSRDVNYFDLTFGDQLDPGGATGAPSQDPLAANLNNTYFDFSAGGVLFNEDMWLGVSVNHINTPDQGFGSVDSPLPAKIAVNGGYKIDIEENMHGSQSVDKSITPTFLYKRQGEFDQLDLGVYGIYGQLMLGFWYRGVPVKQYESGINNHDALIFLAGVNFRGLTLAYSYDLTISALSPASGGSHELSVVYEWRKPYNVKKRRRPIPCPKFYGR